jgi:hypothetical protein
MVIALGGSHPYQPLHKGYLTKISEKRELRKWGLTGLTRKRPRFPPALIVEPPLIQPRFWSPPIPPRGRGFFQIIACSSLNAISDNTLYQLARYVLRIRLGFFDESMMAETFLTEDHVHGLVGIT